MLAKTSTFVNREEGLLSRLSPLPTGVAFGLRSVGRIELVPGCRTPERIIDFVHVVWSVAGTGQACIGGVDYPFPPHHTAAFPPGVTHSLHATSDVWQYRWITLDGPSAALLVSGLGLGGIPICSGPCPDTIFDELERAIHVIGPEGERRATMPAYRLLVEAACGRGRLAPCPQWTEWAKSIRQLIAENSNDPDVGITQLAEIANMDRTTFTYRFKRAAGVSPKEYRPAM